MHLIDVRKYDAHALISINGADVKMVENFMFLEVNITNDLPCTTHIDATAKNAHQ